MAILRKKFKNLLSMRGAEGAGAHAQTKKGESDDIADLMLQITELKSELNQSKRDKDYLEDQLAQLGQLDTIN